jgi:hypothetical protein
VVKPNRLALATVATSSLALPALAWAQTAGDTAGDDAGLPAGSEAAPATRELPPPDEPPHPPAPRSDKGASLKYDGGFALESDDGEFEVKLGLRSQLRLETVRPDVDGAELRSRFLLPRIRIQFEGHAYGEATAYKLEFDAANKGFAVLKDMFVDHRLDGGVHVRVGQWKKPFNRAEIVSDFGSAFLERSPQNELAGAGRDLGLALHNDYEKSPAGLEWALGVFNGTGDRPSIKTTCTGAPPTCTSVLPTNVPTDFGPAIVAHVGWNSARLKGYSEGDLEGGPLRYGVAASYELDPQRFDKDADGDLELVHAIALDAIVKVEGLDVMGALAYVKDGKADAEFGFYGQVGYMLRPKKLLGAVRFAQVPAGDESRQELLGGVNWFWKGHKVKWMLDGGVIRTTGADTNDVQLRTQLQLVL